MRSRVGALARSRFASRPETSNHLTPIRRGSVELLEISLFPSIETLSLSPFAPDPFRYRRTKTICLYLFSSVSIHPKLQCDLSSLTFAGSPTPSLPRTKPLIPRFRTYSLCLCQHRFQNPHHPKPICSFLSLVVVTNSGSRFPSFFLPLHNLVFNECHQPSPIAEYSRQLARKSSERERARERIQGHALHPGRPRTGQNPPYLGGFEDFILHMYHSARLVTHASRACPTRP